MPLARVVRAHAVARAVFDVDRLWDAVRPLDNVVSAATQVELRTEATRLAERTARWMLRQPELADETGAVDRRGARPVRRSGGGRAGRAAAAGCWAARRRPTPSGPPGCRRPGVPAELAAEVAAAPLLPAALDLAVVSERTGAPVALAGQVHAVPGRAAGRWCRCASWSSRCPATAAGRRWRAPSLRDDLAMEQASLIADVLSLRTADTDPAGEAGRGLGRGLGHHAGAIGRPARRHRRRRPARAGRAAGRRPDAARPAQAPPGPPAAPPGSEPRAPVGKSVQRPQLRHPIRRVRGAATPGRRSRGRSLRALSEWLAESR